MTRDRRSDERGSASLIVVALTGVVMMLGLAGAYLAAAASAHRAAQGAADLAALAGAGAIQRADDGCAAAARIAADNEARILSCRQVGQDLLVEVRVESPTWWGHSFTIEGRARAGPESGG